jgi:formylglycine-generating enzyme required for sulfatase activity
MIGLGPKRKVASLRAGDPARPQADDLDDIFVPENDDQIHTRSRKPIETAPPAAGGPSSVKTRLILRRALLRQARSQRLLREPAPPASRAMVHAPQRMQRSGAARKGVLLSGYWRGLSGFQLGVAAAMAGVVCGTVLAYWANDYFRSEVEVEAPQAPVATADGGEAVSVGPAEELSRASATTAVAEPHIDDEPPQSENEDADAMEPLLVPTVPVVEEADQQSETAGMSVQPAAVAPPEELNQNVGAEEQGSAASEEQQPEIQEPATVAAVNPKIPTAPARSQLVPSKVDTFRDCELCPVMVKVPAARFTMGSPEREEDRQSNEGPQRVVTFTKPFAIGQFEVTIADWDACVEDGGCKHQVDDEGWGRDKRPVINVSWEDITIQYLPWLSKKTGNIYRLPSEAEWEYAARAVSGDALAPKFSFGDNTNEVCAFGNGADATAREHNGGGSGAECSDGYATTAPAGSFKPNPFGLFDVHGNVWEWVEDCWNESYDGAPADGAAWKAGDCGSRVVRGGSWNSDVPKLRSATRGWNQPSGRNRSIGFRVVREL